PEIQGSVSSEASKKGKHITEVPVESTKFNKEMRLSSLQNPRTQDERNKKEEVRQLPKEKGVKSKQNNEVG
uniref:Uncharacterized protein n=1 Tax=Cucumis melo TaxID=3656 RepID=A0A9I9DWF1_CUCME